ncbi:MAG: hypothetical protein QM571_06405 [Micrococcaceae bacterium]
MNTKKLSPALTVMLKDALTEVYWYKNDLKTFVIGSGIPVGIVNQVNWDDYKRECVSLIIDKLQNQPELYSEALLKLAYDVYSVKDPKWLLSVDGGEAKYKSALEKLEIYRKHSAPIESWREEQYRASSRRESMQRELDKKDDMHRSVKKLRGSFAELMTFGKQRRGYALEKFIQRIFMLFDIDSRGPFKIQGEQIDGAFVFENTDYLLEVRWRKDKATQADLAVFSDKINRKLDNTLGLFISMEGFNEQALSYKGFDRPRLLLMDGVDVSAILEEQITLPDLLHKKRRHAADTGEIFISAFQLS